MFSQVPASRIKWSRGPHFAHPCPNQSVERHAKLATDASAQDAGFER